MKKHSNLGAARALCALLAALLLALPLAGCQRQEALPEEEEDTSSYASPVSADPQGALEEIYRDIDIQEIEAADDELMESLGFDLWGIEEYFVRYSSGRYGLADVYIVKPFDEDYDTVRETLENVKLDRMRKTESYDILGSHKIAEEAVIYQYGAYLIMLMLEDNEAAEKIIQEYLPSTEY